MKKIISSLVWVFLLALIFLNGYTFVRGIQSGSDLNRMEEKIISLRRENRELETKVYEMDSLEYAASRAADLSLINKITPIYLETFKYARNN